jgi:hypothetical protein
MITSDQPHRRRSDRLADGTLVSIYVPVRELRLVAQ